MTDGRLVIVDGISGAGKSTVSQRILYLCDKNGYKARWFHEEDRYHPIRWLDGGEFPTDDVTEGMDDAYRRWEAFVRHMEDGRVYIMEGCLYQNIVRYFIPAGLDFLNIQDFYDKVMDILAPVKPCLIHLRRPDIHANFKKLCTLRGAVFEEAITGGDREAFLAREEANQQVATAVFDNYSGKKLAIDTTDECWEEYYRRICGFLGLSYYKKEQLYIDDLNRYTGRFISDDGLDEITVRREAGGAWLICDFPMFKGCRMEAVNPGGFEVRSFPITLDYDFKSSETCINVAGSHLYNIVGKTLKQAAGKGF